MLIYMYKSLCLFLLLFFGIKLNAQYVRIPDPYFGQLLLADYQFCTKQINGNIWLDTTCIDVITTPQMAFRAPMIQSLEGAQYFKNATYFEAGGIVDYIPKLSNSVKFMNINQAGNLYINNFPDSMYSIDISYCNLRDSTLVSLPYSLKHLRLQHIYNMVSLPLLPMDLESIDCWESALTSLPQLSDSIQTMYLGTNNLTSIPTLPRKLKSLDVSDNKLNSLPILPIGLESLACGRNKLYSLPDLPLSLSDLSCEYNFLTSIPNSKCNTINNITCNNNPQLQCFEGRLPSTLNDFFIDSTAIQCLPNIVSAVRFDKNPSLLPLCTPQSGCSFYYNINGRVHQDTSITCILDSLNGGNSLSNIKVLLKHNSNIVQQTYTNLRGEYAFQVDTLGSYNVEVDTSIVPFYVSCPASNINVVLTPFDSVFYENNFGVKCNGIDAEVACVVGNFRAAKIKRLHIRAGEVVSMNQSFGCAQQVPGSLRTILDGPVQFVGVPFGSLSPSMIHGDTLMYSITDLSSLSQEAFDINVLTDTFAQIGDDVCVQAEIYTASDIHLLNNFKTNCFKVTNSYDPNEKLVYPEAIDKVGEWLTYTVHFQNTGNDTAYDIVIRDTLSNYINPSTFEYLASSHQTYSHAIGNAVVFTFANINLVDSLTDEPHSKGWVQFRVKTKSLLPLPCSIKNTAAIYFDFNPPIYTNSAYTYYCIPVAYSYNDTICAGVKYFFNGQYLTTSGTYKDTLVSVIGCDSIITLHLIFTNLSVTNLSANTCPNEGILFAGNLISVAGYYTDTLLSASGCDSIVIMQLSVYDTSFNELTKTICSNSKYFFKNQYLTHSGTYSDTLNTFNGCDSLVLLHLTVVPVDTTLNLLNDTLYSSELNASFQWRQCNDNTIVQGETARFFVPQQAGIYKTDIAKLGCFTSSECKSYIINSVGDLNIASLYVYPNPVNDILNIEYTGDEIFDILLVDISGKIIKQGRLQHSASIDVNIFESGFYQLVLIDNYGHLRSVHKIAID